MKTIYTLKTSAYNGTVTMMTMVSSFLTKELAEKVKQTVDEANKDNQFEVISKIEESFLYEDESEVPILNNKGDK